MSDSCLFKWRHYQPGIILYCVRWYLSYPLSYRQVEEVITEHSLPVDHSAVFRWVQNDRSTHEIDPGTPTDHAKALSSLVQFP